MVFPSFFLFLNELSADFYWSENKVPKVYEMPSRIHHTSFFQRISTEFRKEEFHNRPLLFLTVLKF